MPKGSTGLLIEGSIKNPAVADGAKQKKLHSEIERMDDFKRSISNNINAITREARQIISEKIFNNLL